MSQLNRNIIYGILLAGLLVAPLLFYPIFLMKVLCFALFACAFNLLLGFTGLLSFGHAAFFGMSAYVTAHAVKVWGLPPEIGILAGMVVGAGLGLVVGLIAIRRQGIYFAMITLALAQMVFFFALQAPFTGGEDGLQAVPRGHLFGFISLANNTAMYYFVLAVFLIGFLLIWRVVHSPFGQVLKAIRENEQRAISLGYKVDQYKLTAFVMSAALSGLAGSTKSLVFQLASLTDVHWHMSGEVVLMTLLGGMGTLFGPVVGALLVVSIQNYFATFGAFVTIIQGVIFVACVLMFRRGIVGEFNAFISRRRNQKREAEKAVPGGHADKPAGRTPPSAGAPETA
ncbi:branched-chain amino acid ABC transporter permease [Telmatospirillum sp. J64-1]|uniref:branched-chain amino acid ABC transporter permease n=1 Tax=Telmatospirillum sp. J64-1 TaxID=2502183 RepID=UPI00115E027F|nr:branched-chain amino acid ABC transporter permease [Telmatospirillum sp. J64-1]